MNKSSPNVRASPQHLLSVYQHASQLPQHADVATDNKLNSKANGLEMLKIQRATRYLKESFFWKKGSSLKVFSSLKKKTILSFMFYFKNSEIATMPSITLSPLS